MLLGICLIVASDAAQAADWQMKASTNGHYVVRGNQTPVPWLFDTLWVLNSYSDSEITSILEDRAAKGFSGVQVFLVRNWDSEWDVDYSGRTPFNSNNALNWNNDYWSRWESIISQAEQRGLFVSVHCGGPFEGPDVNTNHPYYTSAVSNLYEYGRLHGARLRLHPNVVFHLSQDVDPGNGLTVSQWRAIAKGVADGVNNVNNVNGITDYSTTFLAYHPGGGCLSTRTWFSGDAWIDSYATHCYDKPESVYATVSADYLLGGKPITVLEVNYEDGAYTIPTTGQSIRQQAWHSFFGGAAGYSYGHIAQFASGASLVANLNDNGARGIAVLAAFLAAREWWKFVPAQEIIKSGISSGVDRKVAVRSTDGDELYVYFPSRSSATIAMVSLGGTVKASWLDPRSGTISAIQDYSSADSPSLTPPSGWEDALLMVVKASSGTACPNGTCDSGETCSTCPQDCGTCPNTGNIAPTASVTVSSQNSNDSQTAAKAIDGVIDGYPGDYTREWATTGERTGAWIKLEWTNSKTINKIVLYDRPNADDQINGATLTFSDGSSLSVSSLANDGSATVVNFSSKTVSWVELSINSVSTTTQNVGLAEFEVFESSSGGVVTPNPPTNLVVRH